MTHGWPRILLRYLLIAVLGFAAASVVLVLVLRVVPVFGSMVMVERKVQSWVAGEALDIRHDWTPWGQLADTAKLAVIAAEYAPAGLVPEGRG